MENTTTLRDVLKATKAEIESRTDRVSFDELWAVVVRAARAGLSPSDIRKLDTYIKTRSLGEEMNPTVLEEVVFKAIEDCNTEATMYYWLENMTPSRHAVVAMIAVAVAIAEGRGRDWSIDTYARTPCMI